MNEPAMSHQPPEREGFGEQLQNFIRRNLNWFLLGGLALLILQDIFGTHGVLAMRRSQRQAAEIRAEIEKLNKENQQLEDRVKSLKTDPVAIEHILREERHLARPGEYVFPLPASPAGAADQNGPAQNSPKKP
ncbi:MAG TPA: septum formation initiator family protein [Candidatus Limnocylindrales bacterium]|nr:septum formation initiator family protein [Candidatus Limnocylindrales bacterium]